MTPFPHDGSETDDRVYADWLDDHGRYEEAQSLREEIGEGPNLSELDYESPYTSVGGGIFSGGGVGGNCGGGGVGGSCVGVGGCRSSVGGRRNGVGGDDGSR